MGRFIVLAHCHGKLIRRTLAQTFILLAFVALLSSQDSTSANLLVIVRDGEGQLVANAAVKLDAQNGSHAFSGQTDSRGNCSFANLSPGNYTARVEKTGYTVSDRTPISLAARESKQVELALIVLKGPPPQTAQAAQFFDPPHFTVSGVTDTTSVGGHGSDATVRTRDSLAKDTASLSSATSTTPPSPERNEVLLREKAEHDPAGFAANSDLGRLLLANDHAGEAIIYLERAEQASSGQSPQDRAEMHHLLARAQEKMGHPLEAVHEYQRAAEVDPSETYLFDWGSELLLHRAPEPAREVFTQGSRRFPQSERMLMGLGAAWFASGSYERAVEYVSKASDLNPAAAAPYEFLAKMQSTQTLTSAEVVAKLARFATAHPESAEANYDYAVALWKQENRRHDSALAAQVESLLRKALLITPDLGAAYLQLGILQAEQKDFQHAIASYQQSLQAKQKLTDAQTSEAHYRLAQAYREQGETQKAKSELQLFEQASRESVQQAERQRRETGQFIYTLRDADSGAAH